MDGQTNLQRCEDASKNLYLKTFAKCGFEKSCAREGEGEREHESERECEHEHERERGFQFGNVSFGQGTWVLVCQRGFEN